MSNDIENELEALTKTSMEMNLTPNASNLNETLNNTPQNVMPTNNMVDAALDPNMLGNYNYAQPATVAPMMPTSGTFVPNTGASGFNFADNSVKIGQPLYERNPLERLTGEKGDVFRIRILPGADPKTAHVHWHDEPNNSHNFVCLKDAYNTASEPCCATHGQAKTRVVIPVIVYPTVKGNPNMLLPGQKGELKEIVLAPKYYDELLTSMSMLGISSDRAATVDIIASVDNPTYKSLKFTITKEDMLNQIPNVNDLVALWNTLGTTENVCKLCGKVITREEYNQSYSNYDYKAVEAAKNQPTYGVSADMYGARPAQNTMAPNMGMGYNPQMQYQNPMDNALGGYQQGNW